MMKSISLLLCPSVVHSNGARSLWQLRIFRCLLCSLLLSITSPLAIYIPGFPIPIVLQVHLCLFFASIYGSRDGLTIVLFFLLQGVIGLPVFAGGGSSIFHLLGPSGGYLIGYALGAFCTGKIVEKCTNRSVLAMAVGNAVVYTIGAVHLSNFIPIREVFLLGVIPYIPLDILKIAFFAKLRSYSYQYIR